MGYLTGHKGIIASLSDWALNCVVFITPISAVVFNVADAEINQVEEEVGGKLQLQGDWCPVHSLLLILSRLQSKDAMLEDGDVDVSSSGSGSEWETTDTDDD